VEDHPSIRFPLQAAGGADPEARRVLTSSAGHNPEVALDAPPLGLDLYGAVLEGDAAGAYPAAGEYAGEAACATLWVGDFEPSIFPGLGGGASFLLPLYWLRFRTLYMDSALAIGSTCGTGSAFDIGPAGTWDSAFSVIVSDI